MSAAFLTEISRGPTESDRAGLSPGDPLRSGSPNMVSPGDSPAGLSAAFPASRVLENQTHGRFEQDPFSEHPHGCFSSSWEGVQTAPFEENPFSELPHGAVSGADGEVSERFFGGYFCLSRVGAAGESGGLSSHAQLDRAFSSSLRGASVSSAASSGQAGSGFRRAGEELPTGHPTPAEAPSRPSVSGFTAADSTDCHSPPQASTLSGPSGDPWAMIFFLLLSMPLLMWLMILLVPVWDAVVGRQSQGSSPEDSPLLSADASANQRIFSPGP